MLSPSRASASKTSTPFVPTRHRDRSRLSSGALRRLRQDPETAGQQASGHSTAPRPYGGTRGRACRCYLPEAKKLTQSLWFLNTGLVLVFQPSFLHCSLLVRTTGVAKVYVVPLNPIELIR